LSDVPIEVKLGAPTSLLQILWQLSPWIAIEIVAKLGATLSLPLGLMILQQQQKQPLTMRQQYVCV